MKKSFLTLLSFAILTAACTHKPETLIGDWTVEKKTLDNETQGRMTVDKQGVVYCDGQKFGLWKDGTIVTVVPSPLGEITVTYRQE